MPLKTYTVHENAERVKLVKDANIHERRLAPDVLTVDRSSMLDQRLDHQLPPLRVLARNGGDHQWGFLTTISTVDLTSALQNQLKL